jgi:hypothetical protein
MRMVSYTLRTLLFLIRGSSLYIMDEANSDADTPARTHSVTAEEETMTITL